MSNSEHGATNDDDVGLEHIRAFLAVAGADSQVQAASRLGIQQTTISRRIKRVQDHFGGGLFEAGASGPLSTRGLLVEQVLRGVVAELSHTRDRLALEHPVLRIGFIRPVRPLIERALRERSKVPGIPTFDVRLLELNADKQERALARRELDIAVSYRIPEFANRQGIQASLIAEEPFALVVPERAWVRGKLSVPALSSLLYAYSPRRWSPQLVDAGQRWLEDNRLKPARSIECEWGSEILAYAGSGYGYGFLPALWSLGNHDGVVFVPVPEFGATATISAYSLEHVTPWVTRLREDLSSSAAAALRQFRGTTTERRPP